MVLHGTAGRNRTWQDVASCSWALQSVAGCNRAQQGVEQDHGDSCHHDVGAIMIQGNMLGGLRGISSPELG